MTNSLKPLDLGRKLLTEEEVLAQLEGYEPSLAPDTSSSPDTPPQPSAEIQGSYILMPQTKTYALGVHALQEACKSESNQNHPAYVMPDGSRIYRPLTFKENLQAEVEDYESPSSNDNRLRFFNKWIDSCCGIAYKGGTPMFKLIPICEDLITIDKDFNSGSLTVDYASLHGIELDKSQGKYRELLTKKEVLEHPAWLAAVENDKHLLKTYADIVFAEKDKKKAMGFGSSDNWNNDHLRSLFVNYLSNYSNVNGNSNLYNQGSFLRVAPQ